MKRKTSLYVKDILDAISQIERFTEGMDYASFQEDDKTSSAVIRKLEILGEATKSIPTEIRQDPIQVNQKYIGSRLPS